MFKNYLKIAIRNMRRYPGYSSINIAGLALGFAICIIISLFIIHEFSYDKFHEDIDNLYQITVTGQVNNQPIHFGVSMGVVKDFLEQNYPEVVRAVNINENDSRMTVKYNDKVFYEENILLASPEFFDMFSFPLIYGNPATALSEPNTIVITESMSRKYFGDTIPLGEILLIKGNETVTVTGVCRDLPSNTFMDFRAIRSNPVPIEDRADNWGRLSSYNFIQLKSGVDPVQFEEKIKNLPMDKTEINLETHGMEFFIHLHPVKDIHLHSNFKHPYGDIGNITYLYVFSIIALFILVIASINFINLTTAHYAVRAKEIGVRKVIGADRKRLITQFLMESIIITAIASLLAMVIIKLVSPLFSNLIGKDLDLKLLIDARIIASIVLVVLITSVLSGFYPAVYLSAINPLANLKGNTLKGSKKSYLRNSLVIFQFIISVFLIFSTLIIGKQWQHIQHKNLGFDKENVLFLRLNGEEVIAQVNVIKNQLLNTPGVRAVSISSNIPAGGGSRGHGFFPEGFNTEKPWLFRTMRIDQDFLKTMDIPLVEGRNFSPKINNERFNILVNETLVEKLGWQNPNGMTITDPIIGDNEDGTPLKIIGVLKDFHVSSLKEEIEPMIFYATDTGQFLSIRLEPGNVFKTLDSIKNQWKELLPNTPINYSFMDEQFDKIHIQEQKLGTTFTYFTSLAILIACLGLFGLASFATTRRIKEIGIRKVLGSSSWKIMLLVSSDFSRLVIFSNLIAWPVAWYAMNRWLENFAYRTHIGLLDFIFSGLIAISIAIITVSYHTIKAANANPVNSLRYE